jgi:antitoxin MazE
MAIKHTIQVPLTRIGNSRRIRIPKPLIEQCGLGDEVELRVTDHGLVVAPHRPIRSGWKEAFRAEKSAGKSLLLSEIPTAFDGEDWEW